jgi:glycosyltransferase involved in cell wall biosynthesis
MQNTNTKPRVSVFMPVYNAEQYLNECIDSILKQSFTEFEFVIVNDGSTDRSAEVIKAYSDPRIRFIENPQNLGLIASLNIGLEICKGEYIVRMDQDDISLPQRIEKQVRFMDENPEYGLIGCWFEDFGENIENKVVRYSSDDTHIRIRHLYQTHIAHPTAVIRKSVIDQFNLRFNPEFVHGEDYAFWVAISAYCKLSNYPEMLVRKRDHPRNISNKYAQIQRDTCARVKLGQFAKMGVEISREEIELYTRFANPDWDFTAPEMEMMHNLLERMTHANEQSQFIPSPVFNSYLAEKWFHLCLQNRLIGSRGYTWWNGLSFRKAYKPHFKSKIRLGVQSIGIIR